MSVGVEVDLGSAVFSYRPAAGEERTLSAERVSLAALFEAAPWRMFRWYIGQRHYSGTWWSSTMRDHVIYESRLELSRLVLADFDSDVRRIVAQPFMVTATVGGLRTTQHSGLSVGHRRWSGSCRCGPRRAAGPSGCCVVVPVDSRSR